MAKKREIESGGGGSWMDTYGDLVTLLMCFFVLLYANSSTDASKWQALVQSFTGKIMAIAEPVDPGPGNINEAVQLPNANANEPSTPQTPTANQEEIDAKFSQLYQKIVEYIEGEGLAGNIKATMTKDAISISFMDTMFFATGSADLTEESLSIINKIMPLIEENQAIVDEMLIEGHTDNVPIDNYYFKSNRWLSTTRANRVLDYVLENYTFDPAKVSAHGYGEYRPVASNDTEEGKARNRRVDFIVTELIVSKEAEEGQWSNDNAIQFPAD